MLSLCLVYVIHPLTAALAERIPPGLMPAALIFLLTDGAVTCWLLRTTGSTDSLRWYDGFLPTR